MKLRSLRSAAVIALAPILAGALLASAPRASAAPPPPDARAADKPERSPDPLLPHHFLPEEVTTTGSVTAGRAARRLPRRRRHARRAREGLGRRHRSASTPSPSKPKGDEAKPAVKMTKAEASMFYVGVLQGRRPVRVAPDHLPLQRRPRLGDGVAPHGRLRSEARRRRRRTSTSPPRRTRSSNNECSLLDATDLVFIDAPGAGFSRVAGPDKEKSFYGVDGDAHAFAEFITQFLGKYGRWNSPKYLFGESYGTTRSAVLIAEPRGAPLGRLQRRHPALADPELRPLPRPAPTATPGRTSRTSSRCRRTRRRPGTTTSSARTCRRTSRRSSPRWSTSPSPSTRSRSSRAPRSPRPIAPRSPRSSTSTRASRSTTSARRSLRITADEFAKELLEEHRHDHGPPRLALLRARDGPAREGARTTTPSAPPWAPRT